MKLDDSDEKIRIKEKIESWKRNFFFVKQNHCVKSGNQSERIDKPSGKFSHTTILEETTTVNQKRRKKAKREKKEGKNGRKERKTQITN